MSKINSIKLPEEYFEHYPGDYDFIAKGYDRKLHTFNGLSKWVLENKPDEIEMTEKQFWNFTALQPLPYEEKYWTTFHGIPLRCYEMKKQQQINLGIWNQYAKKD